MKKLRQILAIIGIILLVAMYALAIIAAVLDNTSSMNYFAAALAATFLIPFLLWLLTLMIKRSEDIREENKTE